MKLQKDIIKEIVQWDIDSWSKALYFWESQVEWDQVEHALELGSKKGGLSLWFALNEKQVVCSDLENTKANASELHLKHHVSKFVSYEDINATQIPYENHFDVIVFKSIIGGVGRHDNIAAQKEVFQSIYKALKPGGKLLFAENLVASSLHQKLRNRYIDWGGNWRYVSINEMKDFLADFQQVQLHTTGVVGTFGRSEKQRKLLSKVDHFFLNHVSPKTWKYICYGVAVK